jgi:predicted glycosyltransferase
MLLPVKLLVYSHDTFGLGNIRRMIAICDHLRIHIPELSVLVLTGSPMWHKFRMIDGIDYVKLRCIRRDLEGKIGAKYLNLNLDSILHLRRGLILSTVVNFRPDILLVDKKPGGVAGELEEGLQALKTACPNAAIVLLLRDILDDAATTVDQWRRQRAYELLQGYYDQILVAGQPELYDIREEYQFPASLRSKVYFCGYIRREAEPRSSDMLRRQLEILKTDRMILVTAGGGEDGFGLLCSYLKGLRTSRASVKSVIVTGPELADAHKHEIKRLANRCPDTAVIEFTDQMMNYINAADVVVSMAGYNTICEILSLRKRAVIVPRVEPVQEQKIRAERMAGLGLFRMIDPRDLTPRNLMDAVMAETEALQESPLAPAALTLDALPRIAAMVRQLVTVGRSFLVTNGR